MMKIDSLEPVEQPRRHRVANARRAWIAVATSSRAAFGATVRDEVDLKKLTGALLGVVEETMQPTQIILWLKKRETWGSKRV